MANPGKKVLSWNRKSAAEYIAHLYYRLQLRVIGVGVAVVMFALAWSSGSPAVGAVFLALIMGWAAARLAKAFYFSQKILKRFDEAELRQMWLEAGDFASEDEQP